MNIFRNLYNWTLDKCKSPKATWFLSLISFAESSFFPIPPDVLLIPMILVNRAKAWFYAFICTLSSVSGGIAGYFIGYFFFNSIGEKIIQYYSLQNLFNNFELSYNQYGILIIFGAGFTPFPFKFITIASGFFNYSLPLFILVAIFARGLRFFLIALLLKILGKYILNLIDRYFNTISLLFFTLLVGSYILLKYL